MIGVIARSVDGKEVSIRSKIVIDASGWRGVIRKEMAPRIGVEKKFSSKDMALCYREIRLLSKPLDEYNYTDIFLDVKIAPGGYWWLFPKEDGRKINIGVGVLMKTASNPRRLYEKYLASLPIMKNSKLIDAGAGSVPTRKPLHTLVDNGVIFIGDAASAANPVHGGGIGQSMFSGTLAGETAAQAVSEGDVSRDRLWGINVTYMRSYGRQNASLDIFRIFLQKLENRDINYGMAKRLVDETDLQHVEVEKSIELSLNKKVERAIRGLRRPSLLRRLAHVSGAMRRVRELYEEYPETPTGIEGWVKEEEDIFKEYERSL